MYQMPTAQEQHNIVARPSHLNDAKRNEIKNKIDEFLAAGNKITVIPYGVQKDRTICDVSIGILRKKRIQLKIPMEMPKGDLSERAASDFLKSMGSPCGYSQLKKYRQSCGGPKYKMVELGRNMIPIYSAIRIS